ncbi:hypothetical protein SK571_16125 [Lentzea sp. BCCO 10_0798]|uniref:N-acetylglucosaminyl deacetylase, LmbE family n=1 Tax=Lentzea kristufekii TaxID=3095430 RepID=A0ABU4TRJ6_9PSEU|nr:PIG-L family deacetylase [Lentzea sp. BCCO 10_0798]MDX8050917.1 hypothetical protein [Lentzea sp. BCCO 10_0798]
MTSPSRAFVVSAHLDDAVLSASARLMRPGTTLVTVFTGMPPDGIPLTYWDRLTRAESSRHRQVERLAEDDEARGVLGCDTVRLGELEEQYRSAPVDAERLAARIGEAVAHAAEVWIPAGIGGHNDHLAARDAALAAVQAAPERPEVHLYADIPYALWHGWPCWVTGGEPGPYLDVDGWLDGELSSRGLDPDRMVREVHALPPQARALKEKAVAAYRSQLPALSLDGSNPLRLQNTLSHEVSWLLQP